MQERCISHDAHFDDRSANNVSSRQQVESSMKYEHDTDIQIRLEVNARA